MGPWDQGGPWSPTGIGGVHRFLNRVWTLVLDPHGREPGDPDAGTLPAGETEADAAAARPIGRPPDAARRHRRLRGVPLQHDDREADGAGQHAVPLPRDGGRGRRGGWDEAIRLLLLMLAPAAPHITEELWSRRARRGRRGLVLDPHADLAGGRPGGGGRIDPRDPGPGQRQAARQGHRRRPTRRTADIEAAVLARERIRDDPRRPDARPDRRRRRRQARQPRRPVTGPTERRAASTGSSTRSTPERRRRRPSRACRRSSNGSRTPSRWFDRGRRPAGHRGGAIDARAPLRDHPARVAGVNLQLADGADLPEHGRPDRRHRQAHPPRQGPFRGGCRRGLAAQGRRRSRTRSAPIGERPRAGERRRRPVELATRPHIGSPRDRRQTRRDCAGTSTRLAGPARGRPPRGPARLSTRCGRGTTSTRSSAAHDGPIFEGWLTLAAWAQATEHVRIGLMVGANTFREPAADRQDGDDPRPHLERSGRPRDRRRLVRDGARRLRAPVRQRLPGAAALARRGAADHARHAPRRTSDAPRDRATRRRRSATTRRRSSPACRS